MQRFYRARRRQSKGRTHSPGVNHNSQRYQWIDGIRCPVTLTRGKIFYSDTAFSGSTLWSSASTAPRRRPLPSLSRTCWPFTGTSTGLSGRASPCLWSVCRVSASRCRKACYVCSGHLSARLWGSFSFSFFVQERITLLLVLSVYMSMMLFFMLANAYYSYVFFISIIVTLIIVLMGVQQPQDAFYLSGASYRRDNARHRRLYRRHPALRTAHVADDAAKQHAQSP